VLTLAVAHLLERALVPKRVLARLDDERETRGDRLGGLRRLGLLVGHGGGHGEEVEEVLRKGGWGLDESGGLAGRGDKKGGEGLNACTGVPRSRHASYYSTSPRG
jgi:hypothetical protein